jgi:hypothetical protein
MKDSIFSVFKQGDCAVVHDACTDFVISFFISAWYSLCAMIGKEVVDHHSTFGWGVCHSCNFGMATQRTDVCARSRLEKTIGERNAGTMHVHFRIETKVFIWTKEILKCSHVNFIIRRMTWAVAPRRPWKDIVKLLVLVLWI